uniref:LOB domain-containing protein 39 n=1 Tax=Anthurium amnicola TaxID=1678845 RepID=A0A1D1Z5J3_9ARAE
MSCNGCRVLRKGCSEACALRPCLQWIESPDAQGHATLFVAKFFGRAALSSFISAAPDHHRPALFQSLLFEACGRTVNPVGGSVGLLWTGNWHLCQAAVQTVLRGGTPRPLPMHEEPGPSVEHVTGMGVSAFPEPGVSHSPKQQQQQQGVPVPLVAAAHEGDDAGVVDGFRPVEPPSLELCLRRPGTPSEESVTTSDDSGMRARAAAAACQQQAKEERRQQEPRLLDLF